MSIAGSGALVVSTAPAYSQIVDPIYTAVGPVQLAGFVLSNPSAFAVTYTIYRDSLAGTVLASGVIAAGVMGVQVVSNPLLAQGETIWAIGSPGGVITLEVDGNVASASALTTNQLLQALIMQIAELVNEDIPNAADLAPLGYNF
jgi:hypothetical protein